MRAALNGRADVVNELLRAEADPNMQVSLSFSRFVVIAAIVAAAAVATTLGVLMCRNVWKFHLFFISAIFWQLACCHECAGSFQ